MVEYRDDEFPIDKLLLDPNNYRFHDDTNFVAADRTRLAEDSVQERTSKRLRDDSLVQLKNSILKNGFLPVERVIVRPYDDTDKYIVVEGNRRIAALKWIADDQAAGVVIPEQLSHTLEAVPVLVAIADEHDPAFFESLMGIRHVSGIKQWGGYQRAELVAVLRDTHGLDPADISDRLAMTTQEVNRRYRAFKALAQMRSDEEYGLHARPDMYPIFHEAVSLPIVREWLKWDDASLRFTDDESRPQFYALISPNENDEGATIPPKLTTYLQVRELREILPNTEAKRVLLDPSRTFLDALTIAKRDELSRTWRSQAAGTINSLESVGALDLMNFKDEDLNELEKLRETAEALLKAYEKLRS